MQPPYWLLIDNPPQSIIDPTPLENNLSRTRMLEVLEGNDDDYAGSAPLQPRRESAGGQVQRGAPEPTPPQGVRRVASQRFMY